MKTNLYFDFTVTLKAYVEYIPETKRATQYFISPVDNSLTEIQVDRDLNWFFTNFKKISAAEARKLIPSRKIPKTIRERLDDAELVGMKRDGLVTFFKNGKFGQVKDGIFAHSNSSYTTHDIDGVVKNIENESWGFFGPIEQRILKGEKIVNGIDDDYILDTYYVKWVDGSIDYYDKQNEQTHHFYMGFEELVRSIDGGMYSFLIEPKFIYRSWLPRVWAPYKEEEIGTSITNFQREERPVYEKAIKEYSERTSDFSIMISDLDYDGKDTPNHFSLHRVGKPYGGISVFWEIFDRIQKENDSRPIQASEIRPGAKFKINGVEVIMEKQGLYPYEYYAPYATADNAAKLLNLQGAKRV